MREEPAREEPSHEEVRRREGPTSRRRRAMNRLCGRAGRFGERFGERFRERFRAAGTLALVLAVALGLTVAAAFEHDDEAVTLGTGRAGVMEKTRPDFARVAPRADAPRADAPRAAAPQAAPAMNEAARGDAPPEEHTPGDASGEKASGEKEGTGQTEVVGQGQASYYGSSLAGRPTASGEPFDPAKLTAAHRTLPLESKVRVTNLRNGESVVVRINDRGPFHGHRILDLSRRAARRIGMLRRGKARVKIELLKEE